MIYEWRTYETMPGKLPALHTHLKEEGGKCARIPLGKGKYDGNADSHD